MKINRNGNMFMYSLCAFIVLCGVVCVYMFFLNFNAVKGAFGSTVKIAMPFIYAFAIAYVLTPMINFIERRPLSFLDKSKKLSFKACFYIKRTLSILFSYFLVFLLCGLFIYLVVPRIATNIYSFISFLPEHLENIEDWTVNVLSAYLTKFNISQQDINSILKPLYDLVSTAAENVGTMFTYIYNFFVNMSEVIKNFVLALIISVYMLVSKEFFAAQFKKLLYALLPYKIVHKILKFFRLADETFSSFIVGKVIDSIIIGILCFIGTSILSIPYATLISVVVAITNVIPYFGPFIGAIPSILLLLFVDPFNALVFAIFILALQQFDGNYLGPKILGKSIGVPAFWVIFAIIIGGGLFGIIGMFIGVPTFAVIYATFKEYAEKRLRAKKMPIKTENYK